jgi:hypothetical protein
MTAERRPIDDETEARRARRVRLRDRAAQRLDALYTADPHDKLRSWEAYLHMKGASRRAEPYAGQPDCDGGVPVYLARERARVGVHEGLERQLRYGSGKLKSPLQKPVQPWTFNIEGAAAEVAVAQALGLHWHPSAGQQSKTEPDVGPVQVRHTTDARHGLIVYKWDADESPFVLVVGAVPHFVVVGWMLGKDAKQTKWWEPDRLRDRAYLVPKAALKPITRRFAARAHAITAEVQALPEGDR